MKADAGATGPKSALEETRCAVKWLQNKEEFEHEIGLVDKSDQIIYAMRSACKLLKPDYFDAMKKDMPQLNVDRTMHSECVSVSL